MIKNWVIKFATQVSDNSTRSLSGSEVNRQGHDQNVFNVIFFSSSWFHFKSIIDLIKLFEQFLVFSEKNVLKTFFSEITSLKTKVIINSLHFIWELILIYVLPLRLNSAQNIWILSQMHWNSFKHFLSEKMLLMYFFVLFLFIA